MSSSHLAGMEGEESASLLTQAGNGIMELAGAPSTKIPSPRKPRPQHETSSEPQQHVSPSLPPACTTATSSTSPSVTEAADPLTLAMNQVPKVSPRRSSQHSESVPVTPIATPAKATTPEALMELPVSCQEKIVCFSSLSFSLSGLPSHTSVLSMSCQMFFIDLDEEMRNVEYSSDEAQTTGRLESRLDVVRLAIHSFVHAKTRLSNRHEFGIAVMRDTAILVCVHSVSMLLCVSVCICYTEVDQRIFVFEVLTKKCCQPSL